MFASSRFLWCVACVLVQQAVCAQSAVPMRSFDGQVQAVRQTQVAAQVSGAVLHVAVQAGQRVSAGQLLVRIDARAAEQASVAGAAQRDLAAADVQRKRQLYARQYISKAALDAAEAAYKAAHAQATAAQVQSGLHVLRAPYAGVVASVQVEQGDVALPGKPLLTVYDPSVLRVSAAVPASLAQQALAGSVQVEIPTGGAASARITPLHTEVLPVVDAQSMTQTVRATLPAGTLAVPGQFARVWLPRGADGGAAAGDAGSAAPAAVLVPLAAVVRRAEMTGVYVLNAQGQPLLRQVRLGRTQADKVEVLSGIDHGERIAPDAQRATAQSAPRQ